MEVSIILISKLTLLNNLIKHTYITNTTYIS